MLYDMHPGWHVIVGFDDDLLYLGEKKPANYTTVE